MLTLIQFNLPVLAVALLIGVITARLMFARRADAPKPRNED